MYPTPLHLGFPCVCVWFHILQQHFVVRSSFYSSNLHLMSEFQGALSLKNARNPWKPRQLNYVALSELFSSRKQILNESSQEHRTAILVILSHTTLTSALWMAVQRLHIWGGSWSIAHLQLNHRSCHEACPVLFHTKTLKQTKLDILRVTGRGEKAF